MSKISNVPQIRFKGFTNDWEQRKLGEFCDMFNGDRSSKYPNASDMVLEGIPFINAGDLQGGRVNLETCNKISKSKFDELSGAKLTKGDIVYCLRGSLGKNAYIDNFSEGTIASSLVAIRPKKINGRFLFHILNSDIEYKQRVVRDEGAAQPNLSAKNLSEFVIPIPGSTEEQSVSDFLDNIDDDITLHQRKYNQVVNLKKAMLEKMFPKNGSRIPEIRFKGYTGEWEQRKLGDVCEITTGRLDANAMVPDGVYDFYTSGIAKYKIDVPAFSGPAITIAGNGATVGFMHLADGLFNAYQRTYVLSNFAADRHYLFYEIGNRLPVKIAQEARTGNIPYIVMDMLTDLKLYIPSSDEQKSIGMYFEKIDNLITLYQSKLQQLKNIKKAMLEKMFV